MQEGGKDPPENGSAPSRESKFKGMGSDIKKQLLRRSMLEGCKVGDLIQHVGRHGVWKLPNDRCLWARRGEECFHLVEGDDYAMPERCLRPSGGRRKTENLATPTNPETRE